MLRIRMAGNDQSDRPVSRLMGPWREHVKGWLGYITKGLPRSFRHFDFGGQRLRYFTARYNVTWTNERAVELPIVFEALRRRPQARVLEVGNVLAYYTAMQHDVVDKYERSPGVRNIDVLAVDGGPYDLIIAISTLEHVGWDDDSKDADKPPQAVDHLASLLAPGGRLLVTLPLGYNPHVDSALKAGTLRFDELSYLKRVSRANRWTEVPASDVGEARYDAPFPAANVLAVGVRWGAESTRQAAGTASVSSEPS